MKKFKIIVAFVIIFLACGCDSRTVTDFASKEVSSEVAVMPPIAENKYDQEKLKNEIVAITNTRPENWSVYVEVPGEDFNLEINNRVVTAASAIKLFNMAALYDQIHQGIIVMDDVLKEHVSDMITVSSNDASNEVVKAIGGGSFDVGAEKVTLFSHSIGCIDTKEEHMLYNVSGPAKGRNTTTVKDCGNILKKIYNKECVSS